MHEVDSAGTASAVEDELSRLNAGGSELGPMPAKGAASNIDILDGGISVGQMQSPDGQYVPALIVSITYAIRLPKDGAIAMAEAIAEVAGKKVIIRPNMALPRG